MNVAFLHMVIVSQRNPIAMFISDSDRIDKHTDTNKLTNKVTKI